ncbi:DUF6804 family protein [Riemerella columbipharyngis]|uniref:SPW repeat-containing protein n=1 Tax=Riemerella columbipharyngis TaxID=1071918 RepID=A0A1G7BBH1_9FLAO|nr:DUF6804 family protein [Riemerella columbipharyngis]SDE24312.1 hypothetical protein SAMN05421544_105100 [Riemerella columbipharyngis]
MDKIIKIILALLLLGCLASMPYGYYMLVRVVATVGFTYLGYVSSQHKQSVWILVYVGLVILFQPFTKIALGRALWNIVDVVVAIVLLISLFNKEGK